MRMRSIIYSHKRNLMVICPFICRTHFMSKNVTRKLGSTPGRPRVDPGSTLTFELYFFDIKWILQLNGQIIIKFLLWESIMLLILNQSPRGRIFRFHYLFPITLKREKILKSSPSTAISLHVLRYLEISYGNEKSGPGGID